MIYFSAPKGELWLPAAGNHLLLKAGCRATSNRELGLLMARKSVQGGRKGREGARGVRCEPLVLGSYQFLQVGWSWVGHHGCVNIMARLVVAGKGKRRSARLQNGGYCLTPVKFGCHTTSCKESAFLKMQQYLHCPFQNFLRRSRTWPLFRRSGWEFFKVVVP